MSITVTHLLSTSAGRRQMVHTERVEPSADDIRLQLDRIVGSSMFANADRMTSFLRFVVERALAGEGDQLKEYVVGVAVFGRTDDYDPRLDSIVRVEARRLRTKLDEYYAGDGRDDAVAIRIPRGSYVPVFERREAVPVASPIVPTDTKPTIARRNWLPLSLVAWRAGFGASVGRATPIVTVGVLPFNEYSPDAADELLAAQLTDGVTSELARNRALGVASYTSAQQFAGTRRPLTEIAQALKVEMIFEGSVADVKDIQRRVAAAAARAAEQARSR